MGGTGACPGEGGLQQWRILSPEVSWAPSGSLQVSSRGWLAGPRLGPTSASQRLAWHIAATVSDAGQRLSGRRRWPSWGSLGTQRRDGLCPLRPV